MNAEASEKTQEVRRPSYKNIQSRLCLDEIKSHYYQHKGKMSCVNVNSLNDPMKKARDSKNVARKPTGVVCDQHLTEHRCPWDPNYPECPERYQCVIKRCNDLGLLERCECILPRRAEKEEILALHSAQLYELLESTRGEMNEEQLENLSSKFDSIYINSMTFDAACLASGCTIELVEQILTDRIQNGMAIVRPPGHHASFEKFNGYCFFNNAALAAKNALEKHNLSRILIVDWDVHHGQGTQGFFYDDPRVVYFSIHRYEHGTFWPELREGNFDYVGSGAGRGFNFNLPLNDIHMKNQDYLAIFHQILLPVAYEYKPELVIISSGYDGSLGCPEGMMDVTPAFYAHMTHSLMCLAGGKVAVILEGGYCLESLSMGAAITLGTLLGDPCPMLVDGIGAPCQSIQDSILDLIYAQRPYWQCFRFQGEYSVKGDIKTRQTVKKKFHLPTIKYLGKPPTSNVFVTRDCYGVLPEDAVAELLKKLTLNENRTVLMHPPCKLCLAYDPVMENHFDEDDLSHPECPGRTRELMNCLDDFGILGRVHRVNSRKATQTEVEFVHSSSHIDCLNRISDMTKAEKVQLQKQFTSIFFTEGTNNAALTAVGCLLEVVNDVCGGNSESGVAVIRPPGHHAEKDYSYGFCIYNSVAIAAIYAQRKFGLKRILILDWDIHHGNGIQHTFEADPTVLYISLHMYQNAEFFPYSVDGNYDKVGTGDGVGFNVNIPWAKKHKGDADYVSAMFQVVLPIAYQFNPELVLVSSGFDAAVNDPLGGCCVTPECFGHMTKMLKSLAGGRVVLALEGGYNLRSISYCMTMCAKALLGDPLPSLETPLVPSKDAVLTIKQVICVQSQYWSSLCFQVELPLENVLLGGSIVESAANCESDSDFVTPPETPSHILGTQILGLAENLKVMTVEDADMAEDDKKEEGLIGAIGGSDCSPITLLADALSEKGMFAVVPKCWCEHLQEISEVPPCDINVFTPCSLCSDESENWLCLSCYQVFCGRYVNQHMLQHWSHERHHIVLSFSDLSVWCYACESYLDNPILATAINSAYLSKFGYNTGT